MKLPHESGGAAVPSVLVLAAPSGTGKTTVARSLVAGDPERFRFSTSATTRSPRGGERHGVDYHFVDIATFETMIEEEELVEWAHVHCNLYGTPWSEVDPGAPTAEGDVRTATTVLDIDVQGALQVRERLEGAILVFLLPPSGQILVERLRKRGTDDGDTIERRLHGALGELDQVEHFDFVVVNDRLEDTVATVTAIAAAEAVRVRDVDEVVELARALKREIEEAAELSP